MGITDQKLNSKGSVTNVESMASWLVSVVKDSQLGTQLTQARLMGLLLLFCCRHLLADQMFLVNR